MLVDKGSPDLLEIERKREREFQKASNHSRQVKIMKILLPVIAIGLVLAVGLAFIVYSTANVGISVRSAGIADGKLVMRNPKLDGYDGENRPFKLEADKAIQTIEDPTQVELERIEGKIPMLNNGWVKISAANGNFNTETKKLELGGGIRLITNEGIQANLKDAYIDINQGSMKTDRKISITAPQASIKSQSLSIEKNGKRIIFENNVMLTIRPKELRKKQDK